jgi:hypothetical protein
MLTYAPKMIRQPKMGPAKRDLSIREKAYLNSARSVNAAPCQDQLRIAAYADGLRGKSAAAWAGTGADSGAKNRFLYREEIQRRIGNHHIGSETT